MKEIKPGEQLKRGDLVFFKGGGILFNILSFVIGMFDRDWRRLSWKPWHTAFVSQALEDAGYDIYYIYESVMGGPRERPFSQFGDNFRIFRWLDKEPTSLDVEKFMHDTKDCSYDILLYFWTAAAYIARAFYNKRIWRLLDNSYTCWELVMEAMGWFGKQMASPRDCPMINDMLRSIGVLPPISGTPKVLSITREKGTYYGQG